MREWEKRLNEILAHHFQIIRNVRNYESHELQNEVGNFAQSLRELVREINDIHKLPQNLATVPEPVFATSMFDDHKGQSYIMNNDEKYKEYISLLGRYLHQISAI